MTQHNDETFDFWNDHSLEFLEMAMKRDYQETVTAADGYGESTRDCGDTIRLFLMVDDQRISAISYELSGCLFSHACVNTLIHLADGRTVKEARQVSSQDIINFLKTLPKKEEHCADHALRAFTAALDSI